MTDAPETQTANPDNQPAISLASFRQALQEGRHEQVEEMLDKGLAPGVDFGGGVTPLHIAVQEGQAAVVALLLNRGADCNAVTIAGWTPLHTVALTGNAEIARLLLAQGAALDRTNVQGHTPIDLAKAHNRQEVLAVFKKADKKPWQFWK
ncbi:MAG: hypothetical protein A2521_17345 [Deltaproteobacteria bacterium RIFOXYD12_FULL_57_12]|nr:MAG: hypothetical protein A2521_17345 [Deltaproteobacteria bacterium RIFOXYD12_FULL_57_12]